MVNSKHYHDPAVVAHDARAEYGLVHAVAGLYLWEFVTTLEFEWSVIRRRRPYRWTIWIYFTTRIATLMAVIICLISMHDMNPYNCELENLFQMIFGYLTVAAASLLIVLRIFAIWNRKKSIIAMATGAWGINVVFLIQVIVRIRVDATCVVVDPRLSHLLTELSFIFILATDSFLLLIMFIGLLRLRLHERSAFGLGRLLWKQGLIWILVAIIAEIPPVVFICMDLNDQLNSMFQLPTMVTLSIAATRNYRNLVDYATGCTEVYNPTRNEPDSTQAIEWNANKAAFTPTPVGHVKVTINRTCEQDQTLQASQRGLFLDVEGQL